MTEPTSLHDRFSLEGKTALVTGGSRGLGFGMARGLADAGARVVLVARTEAAVEAAAREIDGLGIAFDVSRTDAVAELVDLAEEAAGAPIDLVVHGAGVQHREEAEYFSASEWERVVRVNLTAPFALSQEIGRRQLEAGRGGSHLFVGSLTSLISMPNIAAYTASKSGIYGITRQLSTEWSGRGIRANAIAPGYYRTELTEAVFSDPKRYEEMLARIPMGRFGDPDELAGAAVFLLSDASKYLTGQLIAVDGGWTAA
ncbi:SDR family oxidoreductase [Gulosibacter sp. 10]|uniref:SDR family oxidoreductase n=1 Tax=Gulosibacter sp. 10 TaxID=1255570 RepID=UPI00097E9341|nr:SDR family oxidoreductase [Gulosibacter sp. 10]SJM71096.1 2-deoxy-D-gluconate 3-dehydrogenase [Gulosibacter sp. 10]